ncbi:putative short chain dehydrogenase/reductase [Naematelia encephala]|uniref:Putative short chain dehydrogenase/reductase n=1 Tax=Naematelia encephala TaxID=71784 RepID=A0A1Y2AY11_9TREE|nr:putative short chain dehydrogenase/reductase [Naematelia encephala]
METPTFSINDMFSIAGQVAVVTGGGTGLGKAITNAFAINGAKVIITGRRLDVLQKTANDIGGDIICIQGDVSTKTGVEDIVAQISEKTSVVDTLVNCAGVAIPFRTPIQDHNDPDSVEKLLAGVIDADFEKQNAVNINGVYFMTTLLVPLLRKSSNPNVTIIASTAGILNTRMTGSLTYGISKAGAIHAATLLAGRLHPLKIRVNCICPGVFPSDMTGKNSGGYHFDLAEPMRKAAARSTLGRPGKPEEIAGPVVMLASKSGMYMNNALIIIDGGRSMVASINDGIRLPEDS